MKKISELPEPYKAICELEIKEQGFLGNDCNPYVYLIHAFTWDKSRLGKDNYFFEEINYQTSPPQITDEIKKSYPEIFGDQKHTTITDGLIEKFAFEKYHEVEDSRWFEPLKVGAKWSRDEIISNLDQILHEYDRVFTDSNIGLKKASDIKPIDKKEMKDWLIVQLNKLKEYEH
jgi:hypothetical protein